MQQGEQKKSLSRDEFIKGLDDMGKKIDNLERLSVKLIERLETSESERKTLKNVLETFYNINYDKIRRADRKRASRHNNNIK